MKTQRNLFYFSLSILFQIHMANFDGFESKISPLPTNPFGYDGLQMIFILDYLMGKGNEKEINQKIRNRDVYCRPTLVIGLFWVAALGGG